MAEYRIVKRKVHDPKWIVVVFCQGLPYDYQYATVIGACIGLIKQYLEKRKYGTMNFSIKQYFK